MDYHLVRLKKQAIGLGGPPQTDAGNLLLRALPDDAYALLRPHLRRVDMINGSRLGESGAAIDLVCFPEGGIAGFLNVLPDERRVAVGLLGREGFAGWPALMGNNRWPHEVVARGPDATALEISAPTCMKPLTLAAHCVKCFCAMRRLSSCRWRRRSPPTSSNR